MGYRYCSRCKMNVQEQYLYEGDRCPLCGDRLAKQMEFTGLSKTKTQRKHDIMVEYIDVMTGQQGSVTYLEVDEETYNRIKYRSNNVVAVHDLVRK